jgi:glycosyltransferase involved in cell wall biosynthesis
VGFDAAYVVHVYHQLGMAMLNELDTLGVPTILSLHDYKIGCANYRLFSERTGQVCTRFVDHRLGFMWAPILEGCWNGNRLASAALTVDSLFTKVRQSYRHPHLITTLNEIQDRLVDKYAPGVPVMRFPHPVVLGDERAKKQRDHFLFIGRLVPEKGLDVVIKAAAISGHRIKVLGDGRYRKQLELLANQSGANVEFIGGVAHSEIPRYLNEAVALVVPSVWHEVSPFVVFEAIAADVPVIASNVGGMPDQIGNNRGYLVPESTPRSWASVLSDAMSDQRAAQRRSKNARDYAAAEWSPKAWHANLEQAFLRVGRPIK